MSYQEKKSIVTLIGTSAITICSSLPSVTVPPTRRPSTTTWAPSCTCRPLSVIADRASATFLLRSVQDPDDVVARVERARGEHVEFDSRFANYAPVEFHVPDGAEDGGIVAFGTDAPHLTHFGTPLLMGPGSIDLAHTDEEHIELIDLEAGVGRHVQTVERLLGR